MSYHTILFDLDGTLTDPGVGITNSVAYALQKYGIDAPERKSLYRFIGPPLHESFMKFYGLSREDAFQCVDYYREYYRDRGILENKLIPDTEWLLQNLKARGKRIVLATSKPEEFAVIILKHFRIDGYFDAVAGATMDASRVQKADVIAYALEQAGLSGPEGAVMVGDREHDALGAKAAGMDCIGVLCGFGSREELTSAGARYIAKDMKEVFALIEGER